MSDQTPGASIPDAAPTLRVDRRGPRLTHGWVDTTDGDCHGLSLPHEDWAVLEAALHPPAPTGPEPASIAREAVAAVDKQWCDNIAKCTDRDLAPAVDETIAQLRADVARLEGDRDQWKSNAGNWEHNRDGWHQRALRAEADVAETRRERDRARRCLREHADCNEPDCQAEIQAALGIGPDPAETERDDLRALFALQQTRIGAVTALWRQESPAERANVLPDLGELLTWLLRRDAAMLPVVEAAEAWVAAIHAADEDDDWTDEPYLSLGHAMVAAVDQMGTTATRGGR